MARVSGQTALTTGTSNANVLSGSALEIVRQMSLAKFYLVGSATGLICSVQSGTDKLLEDLGSSNISLANRYPIDPDDLACKDIVAPLDRLIVSVRNPTGGTLTLFWAVDVVPLGSRARR